MDEADNSQKYEDMLIEEGLRRVEAARGIVSDSPYCLRCKEEKPIERLTEAYCIDCQRRAEHEQF